MPYLRRLLRSSCGWLLAAVLLLLSRQTRAADADSPRAVFTEAVRLFFAADPRGSAREFDRLVALEPDSEPQLWQRGLALYYADRFADGRLQFERHRPANPDDVENVTWHFACVAREKGAEAARAAILPVGVDRRVPMREILALFAGRGGADHVLAAASAGPEDSRRDQLFYAHLYLALHAESLGDEPTAKKHMLLAAGPFAMDHYMGKVAVLHCRLRGWRDEPAP